MLGEIRSDDSDGKEYTCNSGDLGSIPGLGSWVFQLFLWKREQLPTSVFWPEEFHALYSSRGHKKLDMTEQLSLHFRGQVLYNSTYKRHL